MFYPHYTDIPPVNDGYQMNSSAPSTLGLSVTMGSGKGVNSLSWYSATEPNTNFTSGDYTFYIQVATCATASDPDRVTYKLEYTDPDGSNPVLIGSITQSHWNAGACGGGGGGAQGYTVSIAPAHGQVHLIGKRLRLTATLVNGSPTIYFGTAIYLDTPSYYVCTIGGGGGTQPGTGTQPRATTDIPASFTTGSRPLDPHDPQSPNVTNTVVYLHSDHLGSISVVTSSTGGVISSQSYDPWGKVLSGGNVTQTKLNYTGQRLDDTGLLYYHARYYDPVLGRFTSPDSIVPGASSGVGGAGGTVGQEQNSKLTVDFHERGFLTSVQGENQQIVQKGFWFQLSGQDKQNAKEPWGPDNPQALNRYSYVLNNPLRYMDPSGHWLLIVDHKTGTWVLLFSYHEMQMMRDSSTYSGLLLTFLSGALGALSALAFAGVVTAPLGVTALIGSLVALGLAVGSLAFPVWLSHLLEDKQHLAVGCSNTTGCSAGGATVGNDVPDGSHVICTNDPTGSCQRALHPPSTDPCVTHTGPCER